MNKPLVYIAGPYSSGDPVVNTRYAAEMGIKVFAITGVGVIIPHLTLLAHAIFPERVDFWYRYDLAQLEHCTHLLRLPGESVGADREEEQAKKLNIMVFHDERPLIADLIDITNRMLLEEE